MELKNEVDIFHCTLCEYKGIAVKVACDTDFANDDWCICPSCGQESKNSRIIMLGLFKYTYDYHEWEDLIAVSECSEKLIEKFHEVKRDDEMLRFN